MKSYLLNESASIARKGAARRIPPDLLSEYMLQLRFRAELVLGEENVLTSEEINHVFNRMILLTLSELRD